MSKVITSDRVLSIGMDVDKKKSVVIVYDPLCGELLFEGSISHDQLSWERFITHFPGCSIKGYYEAGCTGFWLYRTLRSLGVECYVVCPSSIPKESDRRQRKNDRLDALTLAQLISMPPRRFVRVPTVEEERERELIRTREQFVKQRVRVINQIKAKLLFHHITLDDTARSGSKGWIVLVREAIADIPMLNIATGSLLDLLTCLNQQVTVIEKSLRYLSCKDHHGNGIPDRGLSSRRLQDSEAVAFPSWACPVGMVQWRNCPPWSFDTLGTAACTPSTCRSGLDMGLP